MLGFGGRTEQQSPCSPRSARHDIACCEFDFHWYGISALRWLGVAWDSKLSKLGALIRHER